MSFMEYAEYNEDNGRNEFGVEFDRKASQAAALQSLLLDNGIKVEESTPIRESKTVKEFLDMPVNDKREAIPLLLLSQLSCVYRKRLRNMFLILKLISQMITKSIV